MRELTDAKRPEGDLLRLADEQAALRRVATLVAGQPSPTEVFKAVTEAVGPLLGAGLAAMAVYPGDGTATTVAGWSAAGPMLPVGTRLQLDGDSVAARVFRTGVPARIDDFATIEGQAADVARGLGLRSAVAAPILVGGTLWGVLMAATRSVEPLPEDAERRIAAFSELVATAIANAEARQELEGVAAEQLALRGAATLVASGASPMDVFAAITTSASELFEVPFASLLRYGPDETATMIAGCAACSGFVGQTWTVPDDDPGIVRKVVSSRGPARIDDHSGVHGPLGQAASSLGIGSVVGVPVIVDDSVWGILAVGAAQDGPPLPADASARLSGFTELVTTTLINAEARDTVRSLLNEQAALRRVAMLAARESSAVEVLEAVAEEAARVLEVDALGMLRFEPDETATLVAQSETPWDPIPLGTSFTLEGENVVASVHRTGQAARMDDWESATGSVAAMATVLGVRSAVASPIVVEGRLWGAMVAATNRRTPLPADTESRIVEFTELLATAISNAESREALMRLADEQAALRRVATLVAAGIQPDELFSAVSDEVARLFTVDGAGVVVVGTSESLRSIPVGSRQDLDESITAGEVYRTGRTVRKNTRRDAGDAAALGEMAQQVLALGFVSTVAAPIVVEGELWGLVTASSTHTTLPPDTEKRVEGFCELVATAIANAATRAELAASEARARALADEQAALRRVATLVARGASPDELFSAVAHEVAGIVEIPVVGVSRYEADGTFTILGIAGETSVTVGSRWPVAEEGIAGMILATGRPASDSSTMHGRLGDALRGDLVVSTLGVPIVVEGSIWGFMIAAAKPGRPIPADTEERLARFTELVATAVSNATTRSELIVSRARIVTAGDEARRRIERNLHDGAQQRLVALGLDVQTVRDSIPEDQRDARSGLEEVRHDLEAVLEVVRELSHGLHPALLSQAGLGPSLRALARKSPIPIALDVSVGERPSESTETAVYYVISEALANAVKHARASEISVAVRTSGSAIRATIEDDGVGGAEASAGSGLVGLIDRVEALGGRFGLDSPPGHGTRISIEMPQVAEPIEGVAPVPRGSGSTPGLREAAQQHPA